MSRQAAWLLLLVPALWATLDDTVGEYATLEETFSPAALEILAGWIVRHTSPWRMPRRCFLFGLAQ